MFPTILAPSGLQLPRVEQIMRGTGKNSNRKNLAGYRREQGDTPPALSRGGQAAAGNTPQPAFANPAVQAIAYYDTLDVFDAIAC